MAAELVTPTDELSGLPLPLLPVEEVLPTDDGQVANWHHHFHPASDPALTETSGGKALRAARIQLVPIGHHNYTENAYHRFYVGPPIPTERDEQLGMAVLSCAGYVPERAIDVSTGEPHESDMTEAQAKFLKMIPEPVEVDDVEVERYRKSRLPDATLDTARQILQEKRERQANLSYRNIRYGYDPMKQFFSDVVLDQDLSHMRRKMALNKFLSNGDVSQGLSALYQAAYQAVNEATFHENQTVAEVYDEARERDRLHPYMPPSAARLIYDKLGDAPGRAKFLPKLRSKLLGIDDEEATA